MSDRTVSITIRDTDSVSRLDQLLAKAELIMAGLQDIRDAVARETSVDASAAALLQQISQQLKDLKATNGQIDQAQIDAIVSDIDNNARSLASAVAENTPAQNMPSGGETSGQGANTGGTDTTGGPNNA